MNKFSVGDLVILDEVVYWRHKDRVFKIVGEQPSGVYPDKFVYEIKPLVERADLQQYFTVTHVYNTRCKLYLDMAPYGYDYV